VKVKYKVIILSVIGALGMLLIAAISMMSLKTDEKIFHEVGAVRMPRVEYLQHLRGAVYHITRRDFEILSNESLGFEEQKAELQRLRPLVQASHAEALEEIRKFEEIPFLLESNKAEWLKFKPLWEPWFRYNQSYLNALDSALINPSEAAFQQLYRLIRDGNKARYSQTVQLQTDLDNLALAQRKISSEVIDNAIAENGGDAKAMFSVFLAALAILIFYAFSIMRQAIRPLNRARDMIAPESGAGHDYRGGKEPRPHPAPGDRLQGRNR